ncbi:MAG: hypothetical protein AAGJ46_18765 [Planctomycetota bacterium]
MPRRPSIRRMPWAAYLWPGLPHLWNAGSWAGLTLAVGFCVLLNVTILSTLVWPEWLPQRVRLACGLTTLGLWLLALVETRGELIRQAARARGEATEPSADAEASPETEHDARVNEADAAETPSPLGQWFREAQHAYLAGDWVAAGRTLRRLLRTDRDDIEGLLLIASVWRMTDRQGRAARLLTRLARREDAEPWSEEIERELAILRSESQQQSANDTNGESVEPAAANANEDSQEVNALPLHTPSEPTSSETKQPTTPGPDAASAPRRAA